MNMKPSEQILKAGGFDLSNTIGSTQLEYMLENKDEVINNNPAPVILAILEYLDELANGTEIEDRTSTNIK